MKIPHRNISENLSKKSGNNVEKKGVKKQQFQTSAQSVFF